MGELKIMATRAKIMEACAQDDVKFSLREFHDDILLAGAMPLDVMEWSVIESFCNRHRDEFKNATLCS